MSGKFEEVAQGQVQHSAPVPESFMDVLMNIVTVNVTWTVIFFAIAVLWSWFWTEWRKPVLKSVRRVQLEAMVSAMVIFCLWAITFFEGAIHERVVMSIIIGSFAGVSSPFLYKIMYPGFKKKLASVLNSDEQSQ